MGGLAGTGGRSYPTKKVAAAYSIMVVLACAALFMAMMLRPEWFSFGTAVSRTARRIAPLLVVLSMLAAGMVLARVLRGPVRVTVGWVFNPFGRRKRLRRIEWDRVAEVRRQPGGSILEIVTTDGESSAIPLRLIKSPTELVEDIERFRSGAES